MEKKKLFGKTPTGEDVHELILTDGACSCSVITFGGAVRGLTVPGKDGPVDVALGFDNMDAYWTQECHMGGLVGRYANRIAASRFTLLGQEYILAANEGVNHLHGGPGGFDRRVWSVKEHTRNRLILSLSSPDGEEGYPGTLQAEVTYTLSDHALSIEYYAVCDKTTLCNLTNHAYFNLSGHNSGPVGGQYIQLFASRYTPTAADSIPTGELDPVEGTPMDLRVPQPMGEGWDIPFWQLAQAGGYDHNWVIDDWDKTLRPAARAWSPDTHIAMDVLTTLPGIQFYSGNFMDGCPAGKEAAPYGRRWGFCLETQCFPDSPHRPNFPTTALRPGEVYRTQTVYRFSVTDGPRG